jgi:hypothetical protein
VSNAVCNDFVNTFSTMSRVCLLTMSFEREQGDT